MYDVDSLRRKVKKIGVTRTIEELTNARFSDSVMKQLEDAHIFINGTLNITLIRSLSV